MVEVMVAATVEVTEEAMMEEEETTEEATGDLRRSSVSLSEIARCSRVELQLFYGIMALSFFSLSMNSYTSDQWKWTSY